MAQINAHFEKLDLKLKRGGEGRESIKEEEESSREEKSEAVAGGTFNFQATGQYSPMSTDKRQTFYEQIKSLELT